MHSRCITRTFLVFRCGVASAFSAVPCYHPITAYRSALIGPSGKRLLTFNPHHNHVEGHSVSLPCGRCVGCRIDRSREWAARCRHESLLYPENCFLTLTYANEFLPADYSIHKLHLSRFIGALRDKLQPKRIRFFGCGEYGDQDLRPHYHVLIFNHDFPDKKLWNYSKNKKPNYTSQSLSNIWTYGLATTSDLNYATAAYTARYSLKKIGGDLAVEHYTRVHPLSGNLVRVQPEFGTQSTHPGIGFGYYQKYRDELLAHDNIIVDGKKHPVPRYYLKLHAEEERERLKRARKRQSLKQKEHYTKERLLVREEVKLSQLKQLKRQL